ncbi:unnamed protein product [Urochloa humidicola]
MQIRRCVGPTLSGRHVAPWDPPCGHPHHSALAAPRAPHVSLQPLAAESDPRAKAAKPRRRPCPRPRGAVAADRFLLLLFFGCAAHKKSLQLLIGPCSPTRDPAPTPWPRPPPAARGGKVPRWVRGFRRLRRQVHPQGISWCL